MSKPSHDIIRHELTQKYMAFCLCYLRSLLSCSHSFSGSSALHRQANAQGGGYDLGPATAGHGLQMSD